MMEPIANLPAGYLFGDYHPNEHMIEQRNNDYLTVQNRLMWFLRDMRHFEATGQARVPYEIRTVQVAHTRVPGDKEQTFAEYCTTIRDVFGNTVTAYGSETQKDFGDYSEKAGTKSVGRALLMLGYGTISAQELDEGERVVDAPAPRRAPRITDAPRQLPPSEPPPTNGGAPRPAAPPAAPPPPPTPRPVRAVKPPESDPRKQLLKDHTEQLKQVEEALAEDEEFTTWFLAREFPQIASQFIAQATVAQGQMVLDNVHDWYDAYQEAMGQAEEAASNAPIPMTKTHAVPVDLRLKGRENDVNSPSQEDYDTMMARINEIIKEEAHRKGLADILKQHIKPWTAVQGERMRDTWSAADVALGTKIANEYDTSRTVEENKVALGYQEPERAIS